MSYSLNFQSPHDIIDFVKIVNEFDYDVDLISGKKIVDAKSIVGALAISKAGELDVWRRCAAAAPAWTVW